MATPPSPNTLFASLQREHFINLTTYRRSGEGVKTPLWFALDADTIYCFTFPTSGKIKRLRHTARVTIAASTVNGKVKGPDLAGQGRIITDDAEAVRARGLLRRKYGLQWRLLVLFYNIRDIFSSTKSEDIYIAITPAQSSQT
jgi:uncharacterized protein